MSTAEGSVQLHVLNPSRLLILLQAVAVAEWNLPNVMAYKGETAYISSNFFFLTSNANFIKSAKKWNPSPQEVYKRYIQLQRQRKTTKFLKSQLLLLILTLSSHGLQKFRHCIFAKCTILSTTSILPQKCQHANNSTILWDITDSTSKVFNITSHELQAN